jgi:replicative DNA helicase
MILFRSLKMENNFLNTQAEQIILGTCIQNNAHFAKVADILEPKYFYHLAHQEIWRHFIEIASDMNANHITLAEFFENDERIKELGGKKYLSAILGEASSILNIRELAQVLIELWQKRELESLLLESLEKLRQKKFITVSATLENEIAGLAQQEPKKKTQHVEEVLNDIAKDDAAGMSTKFVPTGFKKLDDALSGGIYAQQLMIIGARPSVGKSSICQNIILNAAKLGNKCLFISLEVDKKNVILKFLSDLASVPTWKILKNIMNQGEMHAVLNAKERLKELDIYINDSSSLSINQIKALVKNQIDRKPVDLVVVDYVQIIRGDNTNYKNEALVIKEITSGLKALAKQYNVSMLALAQINRKAVEGAKQEPTINDFKGSGGIEEDADVAIILHRDRTNGEEEGYFSRGGKLIVAKNRHGRTGEIAIDFEGEFGRFVEIEF